MASSDCCTAIRLVYFIDDATLSVEPTPEMTNYQYAPRSYTSETIGQVHLPRDWKSAPPNSPSTQYLPRRKYGEIWTAYQRFPRCRVPSRWSYICAIIASQTLRIFGDVKCWSRDPGQSTTGNGGSRSAWRLSSLLAFVQFVWVSPPHSRGVSFKTWNALLNSSVPTVQRLNFPKDILPTPG